MHATSAATQKTPLSGSGIISDKITYIMSTGHTHTYIALIVNKHEEGMIISHNGS